ncbi:tetratricopeptide repeat protein [Pseudidiomarina homiensis]|uniref:tetratricopeptide repeat protein n=1 Tax=Pseudidiomarina homiensis TaxID=364198 RepID=UPI00215A9498|nr:tetratricopeptide repeat protein [Pseudidiomarina homiensis]
MEATRLVETIKLSLYAVLILALLQPNVAISSEEAKQAKLKETFIHVLQYDENGEPEKIIALLQPMAEDYPNDAYIPFWLFDSYSALGHFEQAEQWLAKAIERSEKLDDSMWALFYLLSGNAEALYAVLEDYRSRETDYSAGVYTQLGITASASGKYEAAKYFFDKSKALTDEPFLNLHYAQALRELGHEQQAAMIIQQREEEMRKLLAEKPEDQHANFVMAELSALAGDGESAAAYLHKAIGVRQPYYVYWSISEASLGDNLWSKVRQQPSMQKFLAEKRKQMLASREKLAE